MIKRFFLISLAFLAPFGTALSGEFIPLSVGESADALGVTSGFNLIQFVNRLFLLSVGIAAVLAVIMIAIGGFRYMMSDSVFKTGGAKEMIFNAIIGLIIVLTAFLILHTINPEIVKMNLFDTPAPTSGGGGT